MILVAVLAILYSLGVFDPQQYMNEECLFQPSLPCESLTLSKSTGVLEVRITNGLGYDIEDVSYDLEVLSTGQQKSGILPDISQNGKILIKTDPPNNLDTAQFRQGAIEKISVKLMYKVNGVDYETNGIVAVRTQP
jgi:hypothetical protein